MQDGLGNGRNLRTPHSFSGVSQFASDVVARLVCRDGPPGTVLREDVILRFMDIVICPDSRGFDALKTDLRRARIPAAVFADRYIPEIARRLGQAWVDDCMSFADVTMGSAHLQAILRDIGSDWASNAFSEGRATVLVVLPQGEQHTLGAMLLVGQLRRRGISVGLQIAPTDADLRHLLAQRRFDGAMVSAGTREMLGPCRLIVSTLQEMTAGRLKIAVGGPMIDLLPAGEQIKGTVAVTNDLTAALDAMGIGSHATQAMELN